MNNALLVSCQNIDVLVNVFKVFSDRVPIKVCINSPRIGKIDLLCLVVFLERASYSSKLSKTDMYVSVNKLTSTCKLLNVSRYPVIFGVQ